MHLPFIPYVSAQEVAEFSEDFFGVSLDKSAYFRNETVEISVQSATSSVNLYIFDSNNVTILDAIVSANSTYDYLIPLDATYGRYMVRASVGTSQTETWFWVVETLVDEKGRSYERLNYRNGTYTVKSSIGPQFFWNNETNNWESLLLEDHTDAPNPHYFVRNSHICAKIGISSQWDVEGVLYYDPDYTRKICAEYWIPQAYIGGEWKKLNSTFHSHEVFYNETFINVTGKFRVYYGANEVGRMRISYILRPASFLKHQIVCKNISPQTRQFRLVMRLIGIAGKKGIHKLGETTVTLTEQQIESHWLRFVKSDDSRFQFLEERLDNLGHYEVNETTEEEEWVSDYLKAIRLKLVDYEGDQLVRCDVVIGNYTLAQNESLEIDPSTSTFQLSSGDDDAYERGNGAFYLSQTRNWVRSYTSTTSSYYRCAGLRFQNIGIVGDIDSAKLIVNVRSSWYDDPNLDIYGNDVDNAENFADNPHIISETYRPRTDASVPWVATGIGTGWKEIDITSVVQEIFERQGWMSGNALVILLIAKVAASKRLQFYAYEQGDGTDAPKLEITGTTFFESGFETETDDFNVEWTGHTETTGETSAVVTTDPHHGSKHGEFTTDASSTKETAYCHKTLAEQAELYVRGYFKIKTALPANGKIYMPIRTRSVAWIANLCFSKTAAGVKQLRLDYHDGATHVYSSVNFDYALDTWYSIELRVKVHATDGAYGVWVDGVQKFDVTGVDSDEHGNITSVLVGEVNSNGQMAHGIYVDCIKFADEYIGPEEVAFSAEILVLTESHSWTINPGQSDIIINEGTITINVTANQNYDIQVKGSGDLTYGSHIIPLANVKAHETTLGSAITLSTTYQDLPGLTNQPSGTDVQHTFKLWLSVSDGTRDGPYTYTLSVQVIAA